MRSDVIVFTRTVFNQQLRHVGITPWQYLAIASANYIYSAP